MKLTAATIIVIVAGLVGIGLAMILPPFLSVQAAYAEASIISG